LDKGDLGEVELRGKNFGSIFSAFRRVRAPPELLPLDRDCAEDIQRHRGLVITASAFCTVSLAPAKSRIVKAFIALISESR